MCFVPGTGPRGGGPASGLPSVAPHRVLARPARAGSVARARIERAREALDLAIGFVLAHAVDFLDAAGELFAVARDLVKVVVRELAPLLADLARKLLPIPFDAIPIHQLSP